ncbi:MAG: hypothetical protein RBS77_06145 [Candidatus Moranbacteria bacterium]|jgi:parallel beta-helix repeat protein|nr:hypothetical protein [Candidatus Moranbacteria bacterium]
MKKHFSNFLLSMSFLVVGIFVLTNQVQAETEISENIISDEIWTVENSPYHLMDTISVYPGATLTIEPGVVVKANAEKYLQIAGTIIARGNANNLVVFTSYDNNGWGGIRFIDSAIDAQLGEDYSYISGSIIEYADIEKSVWDCIRIEGSSPFISNSSIHNCANGIFLYNMNQSGTSNAVIYKNIISNIPTGNGVQQTNKNTDTGLVKIINNEINNTGIGIVSMNGRGPQIKDNIITNSDGGISLQFSDNFLVENNIVDIPSTSQNTAIGINIASGSVGTIQYNNLSNNANTQPSNSALNIHGSDVDVRFNTITASSNYTIRINCLNDVNCSTINSNNIYNTTVGGYSIWNWGGVDINSSDNYWDSISLLEVENKIFDFYDDPSLGKIVFNPYALSALESAGSNKFITPTICNSWIYSNWSQCSSSGKQTRTIISSSPSGCSGGSPIVSQDCTYVPLTCSSWIYSDWSACSNGQQTRNIISSSPAGCIGGASSITKSCTVSTSNNEYTQNQICSSFTYSDWSDCSQNNIQSRSLLSSLPSNCIGGQPILNQMCIYVDASQEDIIKTNNEESSVEVNVIVAEVINREKSLAVKKDVQLATRLKGKILLQVESRGEAWYVSPSDGKKIYMANGDEAYKIMRNEGIGISNKDLERINIDKTFAKKNNGKIFLQVEARGEAYYIDFDGVAHYLKDGAVAYEVMRSLGLGISNKDIRKLEVSI